MKKIMIVAIILCGILIPSMTLAVVKQPELFANETYELNNYSENTNTVCGNSKSGCAVCRYSYTKEQAGCAIVFKVTYKGDSTPLEYNLESSGNTDNVVCEFNYTNFIKNDFLTNEGNIKCPQVAVDTEVGVNNRIVTKKLSFKSDKNGELSPSTLELVQKQNANDKENNDSAYICRYGDLFHVRILNEEVKTIVSGYSDYKINAQLNKSSFDNSNCPELYYIINVRGTKTFTISEEFSYGMTSIKGTLVNENAGQKDPIIQDPVIQDTIVEQDCTSLLGNPTVPGTPAYYLSIVFQVIKYVAIVILIVFTIIDFVGAVASQDNEQLKKATSKAVIRLILCIVIFILPTLIEFVLQFIDNRQISICISVGGN